MKTIPHSAIAVALFLFTTPLLLAQKTEDLPSAKEVLAKYVEATGGVDAYEAVKSRIITGKMRIEEANIGGTLKTTTGSDGKFFVEIEMEGIGKDTMGSDGTTVWSKSMFTGTRILEGSEKKLQMYGNDLMATLNPEKYFETMTVTGIEKINEEDHYRLEKSWEDGDKFVDFYSVKTGLLTKTIIPAATPLGKINVEVMASDYRKVDGILMSHATKQKLPGNMTQALTFEKIELNTDIPDETFALPEEIKRLWKSKPPKRLRKMRQQVQQKKTRMRRPKPAQKNSRLLWPLLIYSIRRKPGVADFAPTSMGFVSGTEQAVRLSPAIATPTPDGSRRSATRVGGARAQ